MRIVMVVAKFEIELVNDSSEALVVIWVVNYLENWQWIDKRYRGNKNIKRIDGTNMAHALTTTDANNRSKQQHDKRFQIDMMSVI